MPVQKTQVRSLGQEDPLEKEMTTHSSILAWEIPRTEEPGGLLCVGLQMSWTRLSDFHFTLLQGYYKRIFLEKSDGWTYLVVQWIRTHLSMQGTQVRSLAQEDSTCCGATKPTHHNY